MNKLRAFTFTLTFLLSGLLQSQDLQTILYQGPPVFRGARIAGSRPGTEFIFTVPATGARPITFSANNLPEGLKLDASTGIIRGVVKQAGSYEVKVSASNKNGTAEQILKIEIGDKLCLTPPMGWNSWNVFTNTLDEKMVMQMADAMATNGMRDLGYQYINMDDFWHDSTRAADGKPVANPQKFPHGIKWLADYVHDKGLKLGIYSDAGTMTCGKCFGGYTFEELDAKTYAEWGVDLLKYDFCHVPWSKKEAVARYTKMGDALENSGRSIVYSVCNWGLFSPWKWVPQSGGNYWRTTGDIVDEWKGGNPWSMTVMNIMKRQNKLLSYGKHGHWNDPDMLIVGNNGKGKATGRDGKYKGLTNTQYYSHMALWAITNAPLLSSCHLGEMDEQTRQILMDPLLLEINQDELGNAAELISKSNGVWVYKKKLKSSTAYAYFNTTKASKKITSMKGDLVTLEPYQTKVLKAAD